MKTQKKANKNVQRTIVRYPRLDTILMVEKQIIKYDGEFKKRKLWESLPKKMMYQTYCVIIDYLLLSRKISIDSEGKFGWIYYPQMAQQLYQQKALGRKHVTPVRDSVCRKKAAGVLL